MAPHPDPEGFSAAVAAITSAFGDPSRRGIYLFARSVDGGVTAAEVAERFALHPNVARHHLDKLAAGGHLAVRPATAAGAGRPSRRYAATAALDGAELGVRPDDLVLDLLGHALALLPADVAVALAEDVGARHGRAMGEAVGAAEARRSLPAALDAVADAMTAQGFATRVERRRGRGRLRLVGRCCPYGASASPVLCALDRGLVRGMLGALHGDDGRPETTASLVAGDEVCVVAVGPTPAGDPRPVG